MAATATPMTTALASFSGAKSFSSDRKWNVSHRAARDTTTAITTDSATSG